MGGAVSSSSGNMSPGNDILTSHQTTALVQKMKEQYHHCCYEKKLSLAEQQEQLIQSYQKIYNDVINTPHYMLPKSFNTNDITPTKKSRRRSFDNQKISPKKSNPKNLSPQKSLSQQLHVSESLPVLPAADPPPQGSCFYLDLLLTLPPSVDTWDSVSNQPSCLICGMVFSTANKLETHIKYSVSHPPLLPYLCSL